MEQTRTYSGQVAQFDVPDWTPLEAVVGLETVERFMWMFEVRLDDGLSIHAYKHKTTRRYLHLTHHGRAFVYWGDETYREIELAHALSLAQVRPTRG